MNEAELHEDKKKSLKVFYYYLEGQIFAKTKFGFVAITNNNLDTVKSYRYVSLLRKKRSIVQLYQYFSVPLSDSSVLSLFDCSVMSLFGCSAVHLMYRTVVQLFSYVDFTLFSCSYFLLFSCQLISCSINQLFIDYISICSTILLFN